MTSEERLAALYAAIRELGLPCLVMGGHAVRFYGVDRTTIDYDMHLSVDAEVWADLPATLLRSPVFAAAPPREGPSWRPSDFRRFVVGTLPDGREERLEFWRRNHLLAPFDELWARREEALNRGRVVAFLGISDLIRSKETEREEDWRDVALLEEISDERNLLGARDRPAQVQALVRLRSRRGYETAARAGLLAMASLVADAARQARHPVSLAYLAPSLRDLQLPATVPEPIAALLFGPLRVVTAGSARHLALVEATRRLYRSRAMAADRADKERALPGGGQAFEP